MFTGIVEDIGKILRMEHRGQGRRLTIAIPPGLTDMQLGDSINVNGACLTVVDKKVPEIQVDLSSETLERTTLSGIKQGDEVNLERAVRLSDRLGGHIVTGHIDGIGTITETRREKDFIHLRIRIPQPLSRYIVEKGSIAIDGTSLTVNGCAGDEVRITLVPYTLEKTILMDKRVGDRVNVETDILGKYVEKLLEPGRSGGLDFDFLRKHGFIKEE